MTAPTEQPERYCATHGGKWSLQGETGGFRPCGALVLGLSHVPCVLAVLVPVTQRQVEQQVIEQGRELAVLSEKVEAHAVNHDCDGGCRTAITLWRKWSRSSGEMLKALDALAAVQGIPADTEAGNAQ